MTAETAPAGPVTSEQFLEMLGQQREAMSAQQQTLNELMKHMINQQAAQTPMGPRDNGGGQLVAKYFQCPQFTGKPEHWSDFAFRFKRATRSQNDDAHKMLLRAEVTEDTYKEIDDDIHQPLLSGKMYDVLCQQVDGEGFLILKAMSSTGNGFEAWGKLYCKYNPTTFSRGLQLLTKLLTQGG